MGRIINHVGIEVSKSLKARDIPNEKPVLHKDESRIGRKKLFNYRAAVGILSYLQVSTLPEIPMAIHQCARFCNNPRLAQTRRQTYRKVPCEYIYICRFTRWNSTVNHMWRSLQGGYIKRYQLLCICRILGWAGSSRCW